MDPVPSTAESPIPVAECAAAVECLKFLVNYNWGLVFFAKMYNLLHELWFRLVFFFNPTQISQNYLVNTKYLVLLVNL